jgi:HEXXH motif-containing protein
MVSSSLDALDALHGFATADERFSEADVASVVRARTEKVVRLFFKYFGGPLERVPGLYKTLATLPDQPLSVQWPALGPLRRALLEKPLDRDRAVRAAQAIESLLRPHEMWDLRSTLPEDAPEQLVVDPKPNTERLSTAYATLERYAPAFHEWVTRSIFGIVPVAVPEGSSTSISFEYTPGLIALSLGIPALTIADLLVHEASHQHFYLLSSFGPIHDGSDSNLYWSPARKTERPIDKILLAYHAFANVFLFFQECVKNGHPEGEFCTAQMNAYRESLKALAAPLQTTNALTLLGRALYRPLTSMVEDLNP